MLFRNVFIGMLQPEDGGSKPLRNIGDCLPVRTPLQPRRPESSSVLPRVFQIFNPVVTGRDIFSPVPRIPFVSITSPVFYSYVIHIPLKLYNISN